MQTTRVVNAMRAAATGTVAAQIELELSRASPKAARIPVSPNTERSGMPQGGSTSPNPSRRFDMRKAFSPAPGHRTTTRSGTSPARKTSAKVSFSCCADLRPAMRTTAPASNGSGAGLASACLDASSWGAAVGGDSDSFLVSFAGSFGGSFGCSFGGSLRGSADAFGTSEPGVAAPDPPEAPEPPVALALGAATRGACPGAKTVGRPLGCGHSMFTARSNF
mmetsp:Transcript_60867/g.135960  ORF Transcript_60867/g.135960 Transcript_60867/m.135960 type:complete len:221 (-) Transcript_60867:13-675(-)